MPNAPHRIRKQRWLIRTASPGDAFAIRKGLRNSWESELLPLFEKAFDETSSGDEVIHIPKLEIRINLPRNLASPESLSQQCRVQIPAQLEILLREKRVPSQGWKAISAKQSDLESLLHYLQTGSLRWENVENSSLDAAAKLRRTVQDQLPHLVRHIKESRPSAPFFFRLLQLISHDDTASLIGDLAEELPSAWRDAVATSLEALLTPGQSHFDSHQQLTLASAFLADSLSSPPDSPAPDFAPLAKSLLPGDHAYRLPRFVATLPESARALFRDKSTHAPTSATAHQEAPGNRPAANASTATFALAVNHAGLILLHPYLSRFLEATGVKSGHEPRLSPFALPRAAALLHALAAAREPMYEYELALIKVLLGIHPETPLPSTKDLVTETDLAEAETVLQSVVQHWRALKNTSIAGFRSSFLVRKALLRDEENGWKLQVERRAFDLLLDQLPWSITIVKLPWMTKPLYTEW